MFSFKGIINRIFKRNTKQQPPQAPTGDSSRKIELGKKRVGRNLLGNLFQTRVSNHSRGRQKPKDYEEKKKTRRKMAKQSRRINRKML